MNYYEVYEKTTGRLLAKGNARECRKQLGCASLDSFYALVNRSIRGINKKYVAKMIRAGDTDYPVLGKDDPFYQKKKGETNGEENSKQNC